MDTTTITFNVKDETLHRLKVYCGVHLKDINLVVDKAINDYINNNSGYRGPG